MYAELLFEYSASMVLPAFFTRSYTMSEAAIGQVRRRYPILINHNTLSFIPKYYDALNICITPDLYKRAKQSFVRNLKEVGFLRVEDSPLETFRQMLNGNELNISRLYEFKCSIPTTVAIQEEDFVLPNFKCKAEFSDQTQKDEVKKIFDLWENISQKADKETAYMT